MRQVLCLGSIKILQNKKMTLFHKDNINSNLRVKSTTIIFYNEINDQNTF